MNRRTIGPIVTLALAILLMPAATDAQPSGKMPRIGFLNTGGQRMSCSNPSFLQGLQELGYMEGRSITIEWRCAEARADWARQFARELVQLGVDVIVSSGRGPWQVSTRRVQFLSSLWGLAIRCPSSSRALPGYAETSQG